MRTLLYEFTADVNARGQDNDTLLHQAALGGHTDVVCALINEFGCSPQVRGFEGRTLLHYACNKGLLHQPCQGGQNDTPLYQAAIGGHTNVVCALITEFGCSPQVRGFEGRTLLHQACQEGHLKLVKKIVSEFKIDPMAVSDTGDTPPPPHCYTIWSEGGSKRAHH